MLTPGVAVLFAVLVALLAAAVTLVRGFGPGKHTLPLSAEWIDELSIARYRPMMRLLDPREIEFLSTQPGCTARMERRLRAQRCQLFRGYLLFLQRDFGRVCTAIKLLMAQSEQDRPDLAAVLVRHQMMFVAGVMAMHFRLVLYRMGVCGGDVTGLVATFDQMRLELRSLVPVSMPACA
jgi:hypothetical protein